ncbi:MAG: DNA-binding protein WhiA [Lachnospiraceae bacterium]|nr:DNA-binding protein WhiA [Lachnospiraceae bacterium]
MSFSGKVKEELAGQVSSARHCQIAEFSAIFSLCGKVRRKRSGKIYLEMHTENLTVAKKFYILIKMAFHVEAQIRIRNHSIHSRTPTYFLVIQAQETVYEILKAVKILSETQDRWGDFSMIPSRLVQNTCCKRAYLRGVFMVAGSVTNPEKAYHLEIAVLSDVYCKQLQKMVASFEVDAKIVERKKYHVLYVKEGSMIVDILNVMGAHLALMDFENVRILKEVRNSVNRQVNCETANINKTVTAAARQIEDIRYIETHRGFSFLKDGLRETAELRLEYPDTPLAELGQMLSKPLGKSGVNHRLRKLSGIAERLREEQAARPCSKGGNGYDNKEN